MVLSIWSDFAMSRQNIMAEVRIIYLHTSLSLLHLIPKLSWCLRWEKKTLTLLLLGHKREVQRRVCVCVFFWGGVGRFAERMFTFCTKTIKWHCDSAGSLEVDWIIFNTLDICKYAYESCLWDNAQDDTPVGLVLRIPDLMNTIK